MRFQDKVAFVTGGASGLGEATARRFAAEGARLVIADINAEGAQRVAGELPDALAVTVDTGDAAAVEQGIADAVQRYGRRVILQQRRHRRPAAAAARDGRGELAEGPADQRRRGLPRAQVRHRGDAARWRGRDRQHLVHHRPGGAENISPYTFTKAGIVGLTRSAAVEYAARNIRVNAVAPTVVMTPLVQHFIDSAPDPAEMRARMESFNPKPGIPTPDDVAGVVLFLCSDDATWITGHTVPIDGGYVAR